MKTTTKTCMLRRLLIYMVGLLILTAGIVLSTKTNLGISAQDSLPYAIAHAFGWEFSTVLFFIYCLYVVLQFLMKGKARQWRDLLQVPLSLVYSVFINWLGALFTLELTDMGQRIAVMLVAIVLIGAGFSVMVNMELVPVPPDGLTYALSVALKKNVGWMKNVHDAFAVAVAAAVDLLFGGGLTSVGVGSLLNMILVGRIAALTDRVCRRPLQRLAGIRERR